MNVTIKLTERIKDGIISITEKSNVVDGIKGF